jgi:hypothetical protein
MFFYLTFTSFLFEERITVKVSYKLTTRTKAEAHSQSRVTYVGRIECTNGEKHFSTRVSSME